MDITGESLDQIRYGVDAFENKLVLPSGYATKFVGAMEKLYTTFVEMLHRMIPASKVKVGENAFESAKATLGRINENIELARQNADLSRGFSVLRAAPDLLGCNPDDFVGMFDLEEVKADGGAPQEEDEEEEEEEEEESVMVASSSKAIKKQRKVVMSAARAKPAKKEKK